MYIGVGGGNLYVINDSDDLSSSSNDERNVKADGEGWGGWHEWQESFINPKDANFAFPPPFELLNSVSLSLSLFLLLSLSHSLNKHHKNKVYFRFQPGLYFFLRDFDFRVSQVTGYWRSKPDREKERRGEQEKSEERERERERAEKSDEATFVPLAHCTRCMAGSNK